MDSYGEILKSTREEKNLDLDKISRELTIEKRYLVALEEEDSGVFPGEAYLTGFLKNYSKKDFIIKNNILKKIKRLLKSLFCS